MENTWEMTKLALPGGRYHLINVSDDAFQNARIVISFTVLIKRPRLLGQNLHKLDETHSLVSFNFNSFLLLTSSYLEIFSCKLFFFFIFFLNFNAVFDSLGLGWGAVSLVILK